MRRAFAVTLCFGLVAFAIWGCGKSNLAFSFYSGSFDLSFGTDGEFSLGLGVINDTSTGIAVDPTGAIIVTGYSETGSDVDTAVIRLKANGVLDTSFRETGIFVGSVAAGNDDASSVATYSQNNNFLVCGLAQSQFVISRFLENGQLDAAGFGTAGTNVTSISSSSRCYRVRLLSNNAILAAGEATTAGVTQFAIAKYNNAGLADTSFNATGVQNFSVGTGNALAKDLMPLGDKVYLLGSASNGANQDFALARLNADGTLDSGFGTGGKLVYSFGTGGSAEGLSLAATADGKLLMAGNLGVNGVTRWVVIRVDAQGLVDSTFGIGGITEVLVGGGSSLAGMILDDQGRAVLAGNYYTSGVNSRVALARLETNGRLDSTFGTVGIVKKDSTMDQTATGVAMDGTKKILVSAFSSDGLRRRFLLLRVWP